MSPTAVHLVNFLSDLFQKGLSYSAVNTAKSAVVVYINTYLGSNKWDNEELIRRFMRGVFIKRPSLPKYVVTWDVTKILSYLKGQALISALSLLALSRKLAMLLLLLSGQRGQAIHSIDMRNVRVEPDKVLIRFGGLQKQSRPGYQVPELNLPAYPQTRALCIREVYLAYIIRTKPLRRSSALFLTTQKPHGPASRDTLSRWVKQTLSLSGVDMAIFSSHSTRGASTSAAAASKVPLATIIKTAGWSQENTFRQFYHRPVTRDQDFAMGVLGHVKD